MAALAFPIDRVPTRRPSTTRRAAEGRRGHRHGAMHLSVVPAQTNDVIFGEPIFDQLDRHSIQLEQELSVWKLPMPVIPQHSIVANFVAAPLSAPRPAADSAVREITHPRNSVNVDPLPQIQLATAVRSTAPRVSLQRYRVRRLVACIALGLALASALSGASALASTHQGTLVVLSGSIRVAGGYEYTVRGGDTLWSIASAVYPHGDPRVLISQLEGELRGMVLTPGTHLLLP